VSIDAQVAEPQARVSTPLPQRATEGPELAQLAPCVPPERGSQGSRGRPKPQANTADSAIVKLPPSKRTNAAVRQVGSTWNSVAAAEQRLLMAGWLAGFMAHEVNNHLAAALMELELALGESHSPATNELLARLHVAVESAGEVCRSTLGLLRPASDSGTPGLVGDAIDRTLACLGRLRERVIVEVPEVCRLTVTPLSLPRLQQVLLNSTLNALEASEGKVFIAARVIAPESPRGSTWNKGPAPSASRALRMPTLGSLELSIEDNGPGMPAEIRAAVESSTAPPRPAHEGGGFGLSIMQRIVIDVGGVIRVESATPQGTRLVIALPIATQAKSRAA